MYNEGELPTRYTYTGQYSHADTFGLLFYNARYYSPTLGRFVSADTLIPPGVQGLDRYAYVNNNPLKYTDPSGHDPCGNAPEPWYSICLVNMGRKDQANMQKAIEATANQYGIHLPAGDHWQWVDNMYQPSEEGLKPIGGYTPRYPENNPDETPKTSDGQDYPNVDDTAVYIGAGVWEFCGASVECIAAIMAHEAVHSWIEYAIDNGSGNLDAVAIRDMSFYEEATASLVPALAGKFDVGSAGWGVLALLYHNTCTAHTCLYDEFEEAMALTPQFVYILNQNYYVDLTVEFLQRQVFGFASP